MIDNKEPLCHIGDPKLNNLGEPLDYERDIDKNIRDLVKWMNSIPGIETYCSCGGHKKPKRGQLNYGQFMIDFYATPEAGQNITRYIYDYIDIIDGDNTDIFIRTDISMYVIGGELLYSFTGCVEDFYLINDYWNFINKKIKRNKK